MENVTTKVHLWGKTTHADANQNIVDFAHKKIVVIIPSFNEERFIGSVILKILRFPVSIIVVDDGSTDDTASVAAAAGATVVRQHVNKGKGAALNVGFQKARELNPDAVVTIDADGQHLPEELPTVVRPILENQADIVVGSRYLLNTNDVPFHRVLGHLLFKLLISATSGIAISDTQSGYRAFSPHAFNLVNFQSHGFSVESEMQFMAHEQGLRMIEVPITIRYQDPPKRSVIKQGLTVLNVVLKLAGQYRPLVFLGLPGLLLLLVGIVWGVKVVDIFSRGHVLPVGYTLISVMLSTLGMTMFSTGLTLHSIRGLLMDMLKTRGH